MNIGATNSTSVEMHEDNYELPRVEAYCPQTKKNLKSEVDYQKRTRRTSQFCQGTMQRPAVQKSTQTEFEECSVCDMIVSIYGSNCISLTDLYESPNSDLEESTSYSPHSDTDHADKSSQATLCMNCRYHYLKVRKWLKLSMSESSNDLSGTFECCENARLMESSSLEFNSSQLEELSTSLTLLSEEHNISPSRADPNSESFLGAKEAIKLEVIDPLIRRVEDMLKRNEEEHLDLLEELDKFPKLVDEIFKNAMK